MSAQITKTKTKLNVCSLFHGFNNTLCFSVQQKQRCCNYQVTSTQWFICTFLLTVNHCKVLRCYNHSMWTSYAEAINKHKNSGDETCNFLHPFFHCCKRKVKGGNADEQAVRNCFNNIRDYTDSKVRRLIAKSCHLRHLVFSWPPAAAQRRVGLLSEACVNPATPYNCLRCPLASHMTEIRFDQPNPIWSLTPGSVWLQREYERDLDTPKDKHPVQDFLQGQGGTSRQKVLKQTEGNYIPHSI